MSQEESNSGPDDPEVRVFISRGFVARMENALDVTGDAGLSERAAEVLAQIDPKKLEEFRKYLAWLMAPQRWIEAEIAVYEKKRWYERYVDCCSGTYQQVVKLAFLEGPGMSAYDKIAQTLEITQGAVIDMIVMAEKLRVANAPLAFPS